MGMGQIVTLAIGDGLALILLAAGAAKFADLRQFAGTVHGLGLKGASAQVETLLAFSVPMIECLVGSLGILGIWTRPVNGLIAFAFAVYLLVTMFALWRRPQLICRCFGALTSSQFTKVGLLRVSVLFVLASVVLLGENTEADLAWREAAPLAVLLVVFAAGVISAAGTVSRVARLEVAS